jgi:RNA polymerase sigma factor (sigma-70 family)
VAAAAAGDQAAREELVGTFLPRIAVIARRYVTTVNIERSELLQEGVVGLFRALERFDPTVGAPFWAYASWWVRQAMQELISELARPTALSDRAQRGLARVREARRAYVQNHGRQPSTAELTIASGLNRVQVESILATEQAPRLLSEPLSVDDDWIGTLEDQLGDPSSQDAYERIIDRLATKQVGALTDALDDRERTILFTHYGVGCEPQTLRALGNSLGLSAERVRQIEEQALAKLRAIASSAPSGSAGLDGQAKQPTTTISSVPAGSPNPR